MDFSKLISIYENKIKTKCKEVIKLRNEILMLEELQNKGITSLTFDNKLTKRETEVLMHIRCGLKNDEIAKIMYVQTNTIKKYASNIYEKTGKKRYQLISNY